MKKEILPVTQKDIDLHNKTSAILKDDTPAPEIFLTEKEVPFDKVPDGYRIAELVNILETAGLVKGQGVLLKNFYANKLYEPLENYFVKNNDNFVNAGLEIKINKLENNLAQRGTRIKELDEENNSIYEGYKKLDESKKLLHLKVIDLTKAIKESIDLITVKDKVIVRLATKLVSDSKQ